MVLLRVIKDFCGGLIEFVYAWWLFSTVPLCEHVWLWFFYVDETRNCVTCLRNSLWNRRDFEWSRLDGDGWWRAGVLKRLLGFECFVLQKNRYKFSHDYSLLHNGLSGKSHILYTLRLLSLISSLHFHVLV